MTGGLSTDVRHAIRSAWSARGLTAAVVVTLGLGIALTVTVLTVAYAYVGRALPYPAAERLFTLQWSAPGEDPPEHIDTLDWSSLAGVVEHTMAWDLDMFYLL